MSDVRTVAKQYLASGWKIVPIPKGEKGPRIPGWQKKAFTVKDFEPESNIGVRLGTHSDGLTDVDLDAIEAVRIAPHFLPKTQLIHGRPSKPNSHYWFIAPGSKSEQFKDIDGSVLLELRSTGGQTVLPPSTHPSGELLEWTATGSPMQITSPDLRMVVAYAAVATILSRHWPENGPLTNQHATAGYASGFLMQLGIPPMLVEEIIHRAAEVGGDDNVQDRVSFARSTMEKHAAGEKITGGPKLAEEMGEEIVKRIRSWFQDDKSLIEQVNEKHAIVFGQNGGIIVLTETTEDGQPQLRFSQPSVMPILYPKQIETGIKGKTKSLGSIWLTHPQRRFYYGIELAPNSIANPTYYNMWRGYAVEPRKGSWPLYREQLEILAGGNQDHARYIFAWMAETVQHPDRPIGIALSFKGEQGTGKSTFSKWFGALFGAHFMHLDSEQRLLGHFNAHLHNVIVVLADEAVWAGSKIGLGALKRMITEDTLAIERKGMDTINVKNRLHMIIASNEEWFVPAGFDNRRFAVFKALETRQNNAKFFSAVHEELFERGGLSALLYDLLEYRGDVNLRDIPDTDELKEQKYKSMNSKEAWWHDMLTNEFPWDPDNGSQRYEKNQDEWKVDPRVLYVRYIQDLQQSARWDNRGNEGSFGRFLKTVLPEGYPREYRDGAKSEDGVRRRWHIFPPMKDARDFFSMKHWKRPWSRGAGVMTTVDKSLLEDEDE